MKLDNALNKNASLLFNSHVIVIYKHIIITGLTKDDQHNMLQIIIINSLILTLGSQFLTPMAHGSSCGPSYNISIRYLCAVTGEGKCIVIICKSVSPAGIHILMMALRRGLPSLSCTRKEG